VVEDYDAVCVGKVGFDDGFDFGVVCGCNFGFVGEVGVGKGGGDMVEGEAVGGEGEGVAGAAEIAECDGNRGVTEVCLWSS